MPGTLYVVATPIGNLEDITLRALRVLREVAVIAAEDTRHTAKLLTHYGIATPTVSFHEHNTRSRTPELLLRLSRGESVALVSDAGTPVMSDPGVELINACIEAGVPVDPIPGANAHIAALTASGFATEPVTLLGFVPSKANDRIRWLSQLKPITHTVVFFESPHRIEALLRDIARLLGERPLLLARELTKAHQQLLHGTAHELVEQQINTRGEFTVVLAPWDAAANELSDLDRQADVPGEFRHLTEIEGMTRRQAITELSRRHRRPSKEIYAALESAKRAVP